MFKGVTVRTEGDAVPEEGMETATDKGYTDMDSWVVEGVEVGVLAAAEAEPVVGATVLDPVEEQPRPRARPDAQIIR